MADDPTPQESPDPTVADAPRDPMRELAERMGGTLTVASEVGVGSRFALSLPRIEAEAGAISIDSPSVQS